MSYQTWHEYGFGLNFSLFEAECEKVGDPITVENVERLVIFLSSATYTSGSTKSRKAIRIMS